MPTPFETETQLELMVDIAIQNALLDVHTALPGTIKSFDPATQLASVEPGVQRIFRDGAEKVIPIIETVPVQFMRGGNFCMTFPIQPGDQCLLVFSEREIAQWQAFGDQNAQVPRRYGIHDYTDAMAIPGFYSNAYRITNFSTTGTQLRTLDGMVSITLNNNSIVLQVGGVTATLNSSGFVVSNGDVKADTISLKQHVHTSGAEGDPTSAPIP